MPRVFSRLFPALAGGGFLLVLLLPGCERPGILVEQGWVRAIPPATSTTAGYFVLTNRSTGPLVLLGATSTAARAVEMHDMSADARGLRRMRRLDRVEVPAGETLRFQPGGYHLMLFGVADLPPAGEAVEVCFEFENLTPVCASLVVRQPGTGS